MKLRFYYFIIIFLFSCSSDVKENKQEISIHKNPIIQNKKDSVENTYKPNTNKELTEKPKQRKTKFPTYNFCDEYKHQGDSIQKIFLQNWIYDSKTRTESYLASQPKAIQLIYEFFEFFYVYKLHDFNSNLYNKVNNFKYHVVQSFVEYKLLDFNSIDYNEKQPSNLFTRMRYLNRNKMELLTDFYPKISIQPTILYYGGNYKRVIDEFLYGKMCDDKAYSIIKTRLDALSKMSYLAKDAFDSLIFERYPLIAQIYIDTSLTKVFVSWRCGANMGESLFEKQNNSWVINNNFSTIRLE